MEEVDMKVVHIQTTREGRGERWEKRCQRDREGGNDRSHLNGYGKNIRNTYQFYFLKYLKNKIEFHVNIERHKHKIILF